ncbi:MAG: TetR/AcrR family transcriptional regulator [Acidimicrobiales bacterium]|nr:TetR/AcrR family transcriptional regulator [Acidimicrobiales bacterium]
MTPSAEQRQATKDRLFDAFASLVHERGYDAVSLADVAERAGIGRTSAYNYFADKDALVVAFVGQETLGYMDALRRTLDGLEDPVERLRAFIDAQLRHRAHSRLPAGPDLRLALAPPTYARVSQHAAALDGLLRGMLADASTEGLLPPGDVARLVPLVTACLARADTEGADEDAIADAVEVTTTFVLRALGVRLGPDGRARRVDAG